MHKAQSQFLGPPLAVAALAHELSARFLAQGNSRRGLLPHNCEASSLPKELTGHHIPLCGALLKPHF